MTDGNRFMWRWPLHAAAALLLATFLVHILWSVIKDGNIVLAAHADKTLSAAETLAWVAILIVLVTSSLVALFDLYRAQRP